MEVGSVEIGVCGEPPKVGDEQPATFVIYNPGVPKRLQRAVHMDAGKTKRIRKHFLSHGHFTTVAFDQSRGFRSKKYLAEQMGHCRVCGQLAVTHQPFAEHRRLDEAGAPNEPKQMRPSAHQFVQFAVGHDSDRAFDDRAKAVVHDVQLEALEGGRIAGYVKGVNLTRAIAAADVSLQEAAQEQYRRSRFLAGLHDVFVPLQGAHFTLDRKDRLTILLRQVTNAREMGKQSASDHAPPRPERAKTQLEKRNTQPDMNTPPDARGLRRTGNETALTKDRRSYFFDEA